VAGADFDVIVIGGGHNGLVTAAYLARKGKMVCVLERRHVLGGCATTEQLWPGYHVSTAAYVISLFLPQIIRDLRLKTYGLTILPRNPSSFTPLLDGRSLTLGPDSTLCQQQISQFSRRDAERYPAYNRFMENVARQLEPLLQQRAPDVLPLPITWRRTSWRDQVHSTLRLWRFRKAIAGLKEQIPEAIEVLVGAARPILERWFETEVLRATLATDAVIGAFASISAPGTAYVLLHHVMGEAGGARGVWGYVQGGMGGLATALEKACRDLKVEIRRESPVRKIHTSGGRVTGVALESGTTLTAPVVASSVDCHWTFEKFLDPTDLPDTFRQAVARIDYSSASAKINLALSAPPSFACLPSCGIAPHHRGTMHISPTLDYIERAFEDARRGSPSAEPILEMTMPSSVDSTVAPAGHHILSIFVQFAPYHLADGNWDQQKDAFADRCIDLIERYAPGFQNSILHRQVLSPLDLERTFGLTGGNIMQGAMHLHQLFSLRPVAGWADHRTPLKGLYLCGAASHPGGGVLGACGRNAAEVILADM
jgi:phytoene dehydrogenase-like protein